MSKLTDELALKLRLAVAAASAERDARIAELEQRIEVGKNIVRNDMHRIGQLQARVTELEHQLEEARKDAERWSTFLSTRPQSTHEVIIQAIDDAAMRRKANYEHQANG